MSNTEQLQRTERLMMYICDALDYSDSLAEALSCLLGYHNYEDEFLQDVEAFYNYIKELRGIERL